MKGVFTFSFLSSESTWFIYCVNDGSKDW